MPHSENQIYILYRVIDSTEAIFDAAYLTFDLIAAMLFFIFSQGKTLFILYGILTLTLCGGDAFHLVPRIIRAVRGSNDKIKRQLGIGLQVSSITMTVFYILLMYIWKFTFPELEIPVILEAVIWISAAIIISFGCYLPVTLLSKSRPRVGLLMIPKTCAYMWVIIMGLQLLF